MNKIDLKKLIVQEMRSYIAEQQRAAAKENTMKKSELQGLIKEVVRLCVKEAKGPSYKVVGRKSQLEEPGKRNKAREMQDDPEINEVTPPGGEKVVRALKKKSSVDNPWAVAWSMKNKGEIENEEAPVGLGPEEPEMGGEEHGDDQEEIRLIKAMAKAIIKLLKMHQGEDEESAEAPPTDLPSSEPSPEKSEPAEPKSEPEEDDKKKVDESNHKTQKRSYTTIKDASQNPENLRDPDVPSA